MDAQIDAIEAKIATWHKANPTSQRLATIPGIGPLIASAITATVADAAAFRSGREFAAWLGLTPRQKSTGGKQRLGRITRKGDQYLRRTADRRRSNGSAALEGGQSQSVDPGLAGTLRTAKGGGSAGQQDRADRLGGDDERRMLSAGRCGLTRPCDLLHNACKREKVMEVSVTPTGRVNLEKRRASNPRI